MGCLPQASDAPATPLAAPQAAADRDALLAIKQSLGSPLSLRAWGAPFLHTPCGSPSWPGVQCTGGRVVALNLSSMGLTGWLQPPAPSGAAPIPLTALTMLSSVDLSNNQLVGQLPDWGGWSWVRMLRLHANCLTGTLPGSWRGMQSLQYLDLSDNAFNVSAGRRLCWLPR